MANTKAHRLEIDGLRAVGIALVVGYHFAGNGRVSGGVDVFLMISAFLLTGSLARQGRDFRYVDFVIHRFRRLMPQAAIVIVSTLVAARFILKPITWPEMVKEAPASLVYAENWLLVAQGTAYGATQTSGASPFQHFWSLSVQGEIFLLWPALLGIALLFVALRRGSVRRNLAVVLGVVGLASFAWACVETRTAPTVAYFDTAARLWEFAAGGLLALVPRTALPRRAAAPLSWLGLALVVGAGPLVGAGAFPGPVALVPLTGAALVIMAGTSPSPAHAGWWLSLAPVQWVAKRSYGLYLWHWPVLTFALAVRHQTTPSPLTMAGVAVASVTLAHLSTAVVETRFNARMLQSRLASAGVVGSCVALVCALAFGWQAQFSASQAKAAAALVSQSSAIGAQTIGTTTTTTSTGAILPGDSAIANDWPVLPSTCPASFTPAVPSASFPCWVHNPPGTVTKTVVLVGDSHIAQWLTVILPLADQNGWRVIMTTEGSCRFMINDPYYDAGCQAYNAQVITWVKAIHPDIVVGVGTRTTTDGQEVPVVSYAAAMKNFADEGATIITLRDNPRWSFNMPQCVQQYGATSTECTAAESSKLQATAPVEQIAGMTQHIIDMTPYLCPNGVCSGVIGNVYVYMDNNHLSKTYIATMAPYFDAAWTASLAS